MATKLFISPQEIQQTTVLGGNVDIDSFQFAIDYVQNTIIEPLLGTELFDKIVTDYTNDTLSGDYLTLFDDYVKPITKFESTGQYLAISQYKVTNGGVFKHQPDNAEVVTRDEVQQLVEYYHAQGQVYVQRFHKWIGKNPLTEYKTYQDEVNAQKMNLTSGWWFGSESNCDEWN